jgi:hypothetical protein
MATVRVLLEHKPDLKRDQLFTRDKKGSTPRVVAFYTAHYDIHKYLRAAEWAVSGSQYSSKRNRARRLECCSRTPRRPSGLPAYA